MSEPISQQNEDWLERARQHWRNNNSGMTSVRRTICSVILEQKGTFDAERLLDKCRQHDRLISLSTVYRTIRSLVEAELLNELEGSQEKHIYHIRYGDELGESNVVCTDCNEVFPLKNPCLALRETQAIRQMGFTPKRLSLRMETTCDELNETGNCSRRKD